MLRRGPIVAACALFILACTASARAYMPPVLAQLNAQVRRLGESFPAPSALDVMDLSTGYHVGFNANASMPAASTIKVPVMVTVFEQLARGRFDLDRRMTLLESDKDWGSGDLCDEPDGTTYTVATLLEKMIDISDNTAANMLIRLVGLHAINRSMRALGLHHTRLTDDVRTASWAIRQQLRTSPADLVRLLALMAQHRLVDAWSSNEMIHILEGDEYNTLLPEPLPDDVAIAHKTGSLFDTLDDAGIVYEPDAPYVIAVMTTGLPSLPAGRTFIRTLSLLAYREEARLARWRTANGIAPLDFGIGPTSPDVRYWSSGLEEPVTGG